MINYHTIYNKYYLYIYIYDTKVFREKLFSENIYKTKYTYLSMFI